MNFRKYLSEAKDQLDISIQAASKYLTSDKKKEEFLITPVKVEVKYDGIKITLIYKDNTGDYRKDWIVSYKGEIQYPEAFDFAADSSIKKSSIANAQFKIVFDHLKKITPNMSKIPLNTEFFIEFLMKKPTLSSNYTKHGMILIASSPCIWKDNFGKLKTQSTFDTSKREHYSKILDIPVPPILFEGVLGNQSTFEKSIKTPDLKAAYNEFKSSIDWNNTDSIIRALSEIFLSLDSKFGGGKEEGVVIIYDNGSRILKIQQVYQADQEARKLIKAKFKESNEDVENTYWDLVRLNALNIISTVTRGKPVKYVDLPEVLGKCAKVLKSLNLTFSHSKKNTLQIKDDIMGQITLQTRKNIKGNNGSLILGRFQPLTLGHEKMLKKAYKNSDKLVICIVRARKPDPIKNPFPLKLQEKMILEIFPNAEVITHSTGNIFSIMQKSNFNINTIWAGTDRAAAYRQTLKFNPELSVEEIKRSDSDISATKVREAIKNNDKKSFEKMIDRKLWKYFDELKKYL
jgi:cytidyltransferase-like protein